MPTVGHIVTDDILKENLEQTGGLLLDKTRDTLGTDMTSKTADGGLGYALDVITKDLADTHGPSVSKKFISFSATGHEGLFLK